MRRLSWEKHAAIHEALQASCGKALATVAVEDEDEEAVAFRHARGVLWVLAPACSCTALGQTGFSTPTPAASGIGSV
jgi:hypothetical protein